MTLPTPCSLLTGSCATNSSTSAGVITNNPLGLRQSLAILARNLFDATPAETVICRRLETRRRISWAINVALPENCVLSDTSRYASSSDNGSISSV
ncbi:hypothetical protein D3C75_1240550 [compost metagenome]